jgi:peptidyl-prolyl cis-trans isomerase A (cyclophilin A)
MQHLQRRSPRSLVVLTSFALLGVLAACGGGGDTTSRDPVVGLPPEATAEAPSVFRVRFETSKGAFVLEAHRAWAPLGADRLYQLVQSRFFDNTRFFRAMTGFMVQFGLHGDPEVNAAWQNLAIRDDSVAQSNLRGTMSFATGGPGSRTTQVFINLVDNRALDDMGFSPVGMVIEGMAVVDSLYAGYGDGYPSGFGPDQARIMSEGNAYLEREFPKLDFIRTARLVDPAGVTDAPGTDSVATVVPSTPQAISPAVAAPRDGAKALAR